MLASYVCDKTGLKLKLFKELIVWSCCSNSIFCRFIFCCFKISLCDAFSKFNDDACKDKVSQFNSGNFIKTFKFSPGTKNAPASKFTINHKKQCPDMRTHSHWPGVTRMKISASFHPH